MTIAELVALLREARDSVALDAEAASNSRFASEDERVSGLLARIDTALAEHDAVPPSEVEWKMGDDCTEEFQFYEAYPDAHTGLDVVRFKDGKWRWTACREVEEQGYCATLDEAKSAAIAAARGMR